MTVDGDHDSHAEVYEEKLRVERAIGMTLKDFDDATNKAFDYFTSTGLEPFQIVLMHCRLLACAINDQIDPEKKYDEVMRMVRVCMLIDRAAQPKKEEESK